jgi:hypothetical protein
MVPACRFSSIAARRRGCEKYPTHIPEGRDSLNHMLAGKPTGCVASATVLVKFEWRQICAKIECIYDTLPAVPTEGATTQNQSAPFAARASTH